LSHKLRLLGSDIAVLGMKSLTRYVSYEDAG
jgi:hypothetical protein